MAGSSNLAVQQVSQVAMRHVLKDSNPLVCLATAAQQRYYMTMVQPCHDAHFYIELQVSLHVSRKYDMQQ